VGPMNVKDIASLVQAVAWPLVAILAFILFRGPLGDLVSILGQRLQKFSVAGVSLELAQVSEVKEMKPPPTLDTEIRQL